MTHTVSSNARCLQIKEERKKTKVKLVDGFIINVPILYRISTTITYVVI